MSGNIETDRIELIFSRGPSKSPRAKAKDLWIFLNNQQGLKPYVPPQKLAYSDDPIDSHSTSLKDTEPTTPITESTETTISQDSELYPWYNELCLFKRLGLDKMALATSDACCYYKYCKKGQQTTENLYNHFADTVKEPYNQINVELKAFDERVKNNKLSSKQMYVVRAKYEGFL